MKTNTLRLNQASISAEKLVTLAIFMVVCVATAMRLYRLGEGLWLDEILTYQKYARMPYLQILTTYDSENQHFLYSLLAHTSFLLFGESAWALRLPAVLFGVGSIWALVFFGQQVTSTREALLATLLLTFSYHHVWFSQNARGYTGMLFWTLLSSAFLIRGLEYGRRKDWLLFAISAALGVYTHMTMLFVIAGQFVVFAVYTLVLAVKKQRFNFWPGTLVGFGLAALFVLLLYAPVLPQIFNTIGGSEQSVVTEWKNPLWTVLELVRGLEISFFGGAAAVGAVLLFGAGLLSYAKTSPVFLGLFIFPIALGAGSVLLIGHHLWPRFFFFAAGFAVLLIMRGIMELANFLKRLPIPVFKNPQVIGTVASAGLILISALSVPFAYGPKQDYESALDYINANIQPGDVVLTDTITSFVYDDFYGKNWPEVTDLDMLNQVRASSNRTWMVYTLPQVFTSVLPDVAEAVNADFTTLKTYSGTVRNGTVYVTIVDNAHTAAPASQSNQ